MSSFQRIVWRRAFSSTSRRREIRDVSELPDRIHPEYQETRHNDLLCLQWPSPPRNVLLVKKDKAPEVTESFIEYAHHIHASYQGISILLEAPVANQVHSAFPFPVYIAGKDRDTAVSTLHKKVDFVSTLGGDGTILHASSLFASSSSVPPLLAFSMGTLGFLGEWKFKDYKRAFREVFMSGAGTRYGSPLFHNQDQPQRENGSSSELKVAPISKAESLNGEPAGWSSIRGKSMGSRRGARVLLRNRLSMGIFEPNGNRLNGHNSAASATGDFYAMNEVIIHRGRDPHLAVVEVFVGGRFLTEAVADGMIISTPTGSTAYNLSSGGSIVHPLVPSLLLTPICPRSLSFRPLVLPANTPITLKLSQKNRAREVEVSVDGVRRSEGLGVGMEIRVWGEDIRDTQGNWIGGVPSIVRGATGNETGDDNWVGGLNGLLKFNYPFGEEE